MDRYADRVPIRTVGSGTKYDGKIWYELLSSIRSVNGEVAPVDLSKSMVHEGDQVTVEYKNKTYEGVVEVPPASAGKHPLSAEPDQTETPLVGKRSPRKRRPSERLSGTTPEKKAKKSKKKPGMSELFPFVCTRTICFTLFLLQMYM